MLENHTGNENDPQEVKTIIVKRNALFFDNIECSVFNFTDITQYKKLKQQEEVNVLLKTLNASVHHEMVVPLKVNVELSYRLM